MNSSMLKRMVPRSRRRRRYAAVSANATKPVMSTLDSTHTSTCGGEGGGAGRWVQALGEVLRSMCLAKCACAAGRARPRQHPPGSRGGPWCCFCGAKRG